MLSAIKLGVCAAVYPKDSVFDYAKAKAILVKQFEVNNLSALGLSDKKR